MLMNMLAPTHLESPYAFLARLGMIPRVSVFFFVLVFDDTFMISLSWFSYLP